MSYWKISLKFIAMEHKARLLKSNNFVFMAFLLSAASHALLYYNTPLMSSQCQHSCWKMSNNCQFHLYFTRLCCCRIVHCCMANRMLVLQADELTNRCDFIKSSLSLSAKQGLTTNYTK